MMYEECITCEKRGAKCDGPNFMAMSTMEIVEWIDLYQHKYGITNAALAEISNTPKGTIDSIKSKKHGDIRHETLRPILRALIGAEKLGDPCPDPNDDAVERLETENRVLMQKLEFAERTIVQNDRELKRYISGMKERTIAMYMLIGVCAILIVAFIGHLIYDITNLDVGYIQYSGISPMLYFTIAMATAVIVIAAGFAVQLIRKHNKRKRDDGE